MTREDARYYLRSSGFSEEQIDTIDQAFKQEPCDDAVSRQAVKEQMIKYGFHAPDMTVTEFVEDLPPVNPHKPKTGHWISISERLPDLWDERYLVSLAWGGVGVMEYKSTGFHNYGSFSPVPIETVTAWMPLPKPYEPQEGANNGSNENDTL